MKKTKKLLALILSVVLIIPITPLGAFSVGAETEGMFEYRVSNGQATITRFTETSYVGVLNIPNTIGGYPVTGISSYISNYSPHSMFFDCDGITGVTIPDSVTIIGDYAFDNCSWLTSITIPNSVVSIGEWAFYNCSELTTIVIPDSVAYIGWSAFNGCNSLESIYIGKGVTYIDSSFNVFASCQNLESIVVDSENSIYFSEGNCIIRKSDKCLMFACNQSVIPGNSSVTSIGWFAFSGCTFDSLNIPLNITNIDGDAFYACHISRIYYAGTPQQWANISIGENNDILTTATFFYICDVLGHDYIADIVAPTCIHSGYTTYTCLRCGDSYVSDYTAPTGHICDNWNITKNATCSVEGHRVGACKFCGIDMEEDISTVPHAYDAWKYETLPSCENSGKIICTCLLCGDKKTITIDALGHEYSAAWAVDSEPTCTTAGHKSHHCIRCDAVSDDTEIPATGHNYTSVTLEPTCTKGGYTQHVCTICGHSYKTDNVAATGHTFTHFAAKAPTCTKAGWDEYDTCDICGYTTYDEIDALGHNYEEIANGYRCSRCEAVIENAQAEEHHFIKTIVKPTEDADGYTQYTCTDCGYYYRTDETHFESGAKFAVSSMVTGSGKKVILTVSISENPGIYSFTLGINYDGDNMTLSEIRNLNKLGGNLSLGNNRVLWLNSNGVNSSFNGDIFQLVFDVSAYAPSQDYSVSLSYNAGNIVNYQLDDVNFALESGVITVEGFTAGDINGDGFCNNKDLVILSEVFAKNYTAYKKGKAHTEANKIKGFNLFGTAGMNILKDIDIVVLGTTIKRAALDINNDGTINNYDLLTMMKYLRGEEIEIL